MAKRPKTDIEQEEAYNDLIQTKDYDITRDFGNDEGTGLWEAETKLWIDTGSLKGLLYQEDWVYITVDLCSLKISSQNLQVVRTTIEDGKKVVVPAEAHPVQKLLENPNPFQDYHAWMYSLACDLILTGNSIQYNAMQNGQLIPIPAEVIGPSMNRAGMVDGYLVSSAQVPGMQNKKATKLATSEVIHIKRPNPSSLFWGLSPFTAGRKVVLFNRYTTEYLNNFYLKGASPQLVLEMNSEANEKVALRLLKSFEMAYTGRRNQRRTLITPKGISAKAISHSLADQQLIDYINQNRETILALLKVPKHEVGLQSSGSLGSEEYKVALRNFWASTIIPHMKMIEGELTKALSKQLGEGYSIKFDISNVDVLQDDKFKKAELAEKLLKTHTLNEVRQLYQLNPVDGGDVVGGTQQSPFGLLPSPSTEPQGEQSEPKPTMPEESATIAESLDERSLLIKSRHQRAETFIKANAKWFDKREKLVGEAAQKSFDAVHKMFVGMNQSLSTSLVNGAKKFLEEKSVKAADITNKNSLKKYLEDILLSWEGKWSKDYMSVLDVLLDVGYSATLSAPFNMKDKAAIEALGAKNAKGRREILKARGLESFQGISKTTSDRIVGAIERGVEAGKTIDEITKDVKAAAGAEALASRAEMIARTETLTAVSMGQAAAMEDAAKIIPNLKKMWITAGDERVRGTPGGPKSEFNHYELHGDVIDVGAKFENGLSYPREPGGEAGNVINCRCSWITLPADQMDLASDTMNSEETPS
jgi:HK97 family phage portal protein